MLHSFHLFFFFFSGKARTEKADGQQLFTSFWTLNYQPRDSQIAVSVKEQSNMERLASCNCAEWTQ